MNERVTECLQNFGVRHYNCAQSVLCTYADEMGVDKEVLYRLAESLGGGLGGLEEVCGAFSAACLVLGYHTSDGNLDGGHTKFVTRKAIGEAAEAFREEMGSIVCREILKNPPSDPVPSPRTEEYYATRPCVRMVYCAANILEEYISANPPKKDN